MGWPGLRFQLTNLAHPSWQPPTDCVFQPPLTSCFFQRHKESCSGKRWKTRNERSPWTPLCRCWFWHSVFTWWPHREMTQTHFFSPGQHCFVLQPSDFTWTFSSLSQCPSNRKSASSKILLAIRILKNVYSQFPNTFFPQPLHLDGCWGVRGAARCNSWSHDTLIVSEATGWTSDW